MTDRIVDNCRNRLSLICLFVISAMPIFFGPSGTSAAQEKAKAKFKPPKGCICYRASGPIKIDGLPDEEAWKKAPSIGPFVDIRGLNYPKPWLKTDVKVLWDDEYLYVAAKLEDPHVWGTLTKHDSYIFTNNDFEVFFDPDGDSLDYLEFEINVLDTTYDLLFHTPYPPGGPLDTSFEIPGMKHAVHVKGTANNPGDTDKGWSVELAFPWKILAGFAHRPIPPKDGDQWRVNFVRVEYPFKIVNGQYHKTAPTNVALWVWTAQDVWNIHLPAKWGYMQFSTAEVGKAVFRPDPTAPARLLLHQIYCAQIDYHKKNNRWAADLSELPGKWLEHESLAGSALIRTDEKGFQATVRMKHSDGRLQLWHTNEQGRVWTD